MVRTDYPLKEYYGEIYPTYDRVNRIFTFGRDVTWRRKAARACLGSKPGKIVDICTGTGDFALELARQSTNRVTVTGFDFSPEMLELARQKCAGLEGSDNVSIKFMEGDVASMPFEDAHFDAAGITFGIRNLIFENSRATQYLSEIHRILKPGGRLVILESSRPASVLWRLFNTFYLQLILPYLGGLISGHLKAYRYLARSSRNYYSVQEMGRILESAGFRFSEGRSLFLGSVMLVIGIKYISNDH
jgi:demethylmenaquinone methyltransferase/2-methoxy-6-polyprenyl-1,4-benzoquinol methylase